MLIKYTSNILVLFKYIIYHSIYFIYLTFNLNIRKYEKMLIKYTLNILILYLNILFIIMYILNILILI